MLKIDRVIGSRLDSDLSEHLHQLQHRDAIDIVNIPVADLARRRLLSRTQSGEDIAIALPRHQKLFDGAVLYLTESRAIVVRAATQRWLRLQPRSISDAIELGYHAGNLHWRVRFNKEVMFVALEGQPEDYHSRLGDLITSRRVQTSVVSDDDQNFEADVLSPTHEHAAGRHGHGQHA